VNSGGVMAKDCNMQWAIMGMGNDQKGDWQKVKRAAAKDRKHFSKFQEQSENDESQNCSRTYSATI
jgi:hypothetical protein